MLTPHLIDPVDLAVTFLGREHAQVSIERLAGEGPLSASALELRAREAMQDLAGGLGFAEAELVEISK